MKNLSKFEVLSPFSPDYSLSGFPDVGMSFESNDFNLQYQPPHYIPPNRLDAPFMPPSIHRFNATRPLMALPPQMSAQYPFALAPWSTIASKNTTLVPVQIRAAEKEKIDTDKDDTKKKSRRSIANKQHVSGFYVVEDAETNVIDTWKDANDYKYFSNRWPTNNKPKERIDLRKINPKRIRKQPIPLVKTDTVNLSYEIDVPKSLKSMIRIIPVKKNILRELKAKLKKIKEKRKVPPIVKKLVRLEKRNTVSKIRDISHTPLSEEKNKNRVKY